MTTREEVRTAWANEELAQVISQLTRLHTEFKDNSGLIQHELIEQAIDKLYHAYTLSKPNDNLDALLIVDGMNNAPRQIDHFN
jgi:hypothetical protein|tara:strand:- start:308 stop:556 length:249 start_codon:yes stop_codon:yes gene_type:complete